MKKFFVLSILAVACIAALSGCGYEETTITINDDGTALVEVLGAVDTDFQNEYLERMNEELPDDWHEFEYKGNTYFVRDEGYGSNQCDNITELNRICTGHDGDLSGSAEFQGYTSSWEPTFVQNADGSITTKIVLSESRYVEGCYADASYYPQEMYNKYLESMHDLLHINYPSNVKMVSEKQYPGITIDGNKLTIDFVDVGTVIDTLVFTTEPTKTTTVEQPAPAPVVEEQPATVVIDEHPTAQLSSQNLTVDGKLIEGLEIYNINGNNYFKLRDVASILNGTDAQFSIFYVEETHNVLVDNGNAYTPVGGECVFSGDKSSTVKPSSCGIIIDGQFVNITAYNIGGNNFLKLRDLLSYTNANVEWNDSTRTIEIATH